MTTIDSKLAEIIKNLNAKGRARLKAPVPTGLSGLVIEFLSYVKPSTGPLQASNTQTITFL